ncbi:MAG: diacylglycerol/lipid kinase family protein [Lachnospiraceae bacterium]
MKRLLFIINPKAGKGLLRTRLLDVITMFTKKEYEVIVHPTRFEKDAFNKVIEYNTNIDIVVCAGGDGTLDEVVSGMVKCGCKHPLGYIPTGSTNDFASSLGLSKNILHAARTIMKGKLFSCDIGRFNQDSFVYIAAFGLFTDVAYETNQDLKNILGHLAYMLEGMKKIFDVKSYEMNVKTEQQEYNGDYIYGMVTNSISVGGFKNLIGAEVDLSDGLFEITLIRRPKNPIELQEIISALLLAEDNTELIHTFKAASLDLVSETKVPWTLDGEYGGKHKEVQIRNMHKVLEIFTD